MLRWVFDLAVVAVVIACILHFSRRKSVDCAWARLRAACVVETEDSLGRVEHTEIAGIRGAAYRSRNEVGLVTDAQNKDETAFFGTRAITLDDAASAERLRAFATDRDPEHFAIASGVAHPRWMTASLLVALGIYAFVTRRRRSVLARRES